MEKLSQLETIEGVTFQTDRNGIIRDLGRQNWNVFAAENGAPELTAESVIGRSLFDFIAGDQVKDQFRQIMERTAQDPNWVWVFPFRCDAPDRERHIRQVLKPLFADGACTGFLFQSVEERTQLRPPMGLYDFKKLAKMADEGRNLPLVTMCSWCQRVRTMLNDTETWVTAEDYYASGGRSAVRISHAVCDECLDKMSMSVHAHEQES